MSTMPMAPPVTYHSQSLFLGGPIHGGIYVQSGLHELHSHDFFEVAVIGTGAGRHVTSDEARDLQHGDVIVLRPGAWHGFTDCDHLTVANCLISAAALRDELGWLKDLPSIHHLLWRDTLASGTQGILLTKVSPDEAEQAINEIRLLALDLAAPFRQPHRIIGRMLTFLGTLADSRERNPGQPQLAMHPAVAAAIAMLEESPAHPWTLEDLAETVNLAPAYLARLFRRYVGLPPITMLARIRAEKAASLLTRTALPTARVGAAVGWDDPTYFARRFRSVIGLTPSEYRNYSRSRPHDHRDHTHAAPAPTPTPTPTTSTI